ncbi:MAG: DUF4134 family protein [Bacteroidales bacterium]|nr:DUF4134 family protein [Candidatus Scybalocola fimicaballi]MCQ2191012.1 DUF4134 domain-containing protein [Paludibacteraceae bacterium]
MNTQKKNLLKWGMVALCLSLATNSYADLDASALNQQISTTTDTLKGLGKGLLTLVQVCCGLASIYGILTVVKKHLSNEQDANKALTGWVGGVLVLTALSSLVKALFF